MKVTGEDFVVHPVDNCLRVRGRWREYLQRVEFKINEVCMHNQKVYEFLRRQYKQWEHLSEGTGKFPAVASLQ